VVVGTLGGDRVNVRDAVTALLMALLLAGCGAGRERPYSELGPARHAVDGLVGRRCHYVSEPRVPASLEAMTRPGTRGALLFWGRDAVAADTVELSVRYGSDGRLAWARAIRSTMAGDRVAELERLIGSGLDERGPADWGMRLRIVDGDVDAVLPSVVCHPERGSRMGTTVAPIGTSREVAEAWQARGRHMEVLVALDEQGRVMDVRMSRSSGSRLLDQWAVDEARSYRYHPKLHDGIGVPSTIPLRLRVPRR
jgi:TonB family protein